MKNDVAILVKVDVETKKKMKLMRINWSEEIRTFINGKVENQGNQALAVALTDAIFSSRKRSEEDSALIIRKFREERYGKNSG
jgi:hypothetical protein